MAVHPPHAVSGLMGDHGSIKEPSGFARYVQIVFEAGGKTGIIVALRTAVRLMQALFLASILHDTL
jgi:hypothetical protein